MGTDVRIVEQHYQFPFRLHDFQYESVEEGAVMSSSLLRAKVGCVDKDTEFLTPDKGWVKISEYQEGDYVCQVDPEAGYQSSFVKPLRYIKEPETMMLRFKNKYGLDQVLSLDHTMLLKALSEFGVQQETASASEVAETLMRWADDKGGAKTTIPPGNLGIPTICNMFSNNRGLPVSDEHLRLMVAVIADGSYTSSEIATVKFRVKKQEKKDRIRQLLLAAGVEWSEKSRDYPTAVGFTVFRFKPGWRRKHYPISWLAHISRRQVDIIKDEVFFWDGGKYGKRRMFFTRVKESADFVQAIFSGTGETSTLTAHTRERRGKQEIDYIVQVYSNGKGCVSLTGQSNGVKRSNVTHLSPVDGFKYCFTVPSGFLLLRRNGRIFVTGNCGKTAMSLYLGLYHSIVNGVEQILILAPPALLDQWAQFIEQIRGIDGYLIFRGSPAERKKMDLLAEPAVLMSYNIFRSDYTRVDLWARKRKLFIIGDELSLKSSNQTFKKVKTLVYRAMRINPERDKPFHYLCGLNATPVSDRKQVYWWCSIFYPDAYPSLRYFELRHAKEKDHWGNVVEWERTDEMDQNFDHFSVLSDNANIELPEAVYTEVPYLLDNQHMKLYKDIKDAEFGMLSDDATMLAIESLFSTLQRVVLCPEEYGLQIRSPILDIIDHYLDQLHVDDRVLIYTRHVAVSKMLVKAYPQAVSYFGAVTDKQKKESLRLFKSGEAEIMIANLDSLSKGQNLQIANHTIFTELPFRSDSMTQACGRTLRQGQTKTCFFQVPLALKTIQTQIYKRLLQNDEDLQKFNRNKKALREFIEG